MSAAWEDQVVPPLAVLSLSDFIIMQFLSNHDVLADAAYSYHIKMYGCIYKYR